MRSLADIARHTALQFDMFGGAPVVVAMVSGGADSVALLRLLASGELGELGGLSVLHVNHQLRGADSDADEAFVLELCNRLGVPCTAVGYDVAGYAASSGLNLEDAGRRIRYRFASDELEARCDEAGVPLSQGRIAVAHTADDRLETFLARVVSGAGPGGLASIRPVRGNVVRPLVEARRSQVEEYLRDCDQQWREDVTNEDISRERAWIRHALLPLVEEWNPSFDRTARRTMAILSEEDALLQEMADAFAHDFTRIEPEGLEVDQAAMRTLSHPMARRTLRSAIVRAFPEGTRLEFDHLEALARGLSHERFARDLSFGLRAEAEYGTLRIFRADVARSTLAPGLLHRFGSLDLGAAGRMEAMKGSADAIAREPYRVSIDADAVRWPLVVDRVREGDRIHPFGFEGTKKLSDLFVDAKVPRRLRALTPVVKDGERVVWVAGVRLSEECRVTPETREVVDIVWHRPAGWRTGPAV